MDASMARIELRCETHKCNLQKDSYHSKILHQESAGDFTIDSDALICPEDKSGYDCANTWTIELL